VQTYSSGEEVGWIDRIPRRTLRARIVVGRLRKREAEAAPALTTTRQTDETGPLSRRSARRDDD
jgi:hypothetical protein